MTSAAPKGFIALTDDRQKGDMSEAIHAVYHHVYGWPAPACST
jgi:hypothetical protein